MSYTLKLDPLAKPDIDNNIDWYEEKQTKLKKKNLIILSKKSSKWFARQ